MLSSLLPRASSSRVAQACSRGVSTFPASVLIAPCSKGFIERKEVSHARLGFPSSLFLAGSRGRFVQPLGGASTRTSVAMSRGSASTRASVAMSRGFVLPLEMGRGFAAEASAQKTSSARPVIKKMGALSKSQKKNFQGNIGRYQQMGGREEFHNVDKNRYGRIFEPWHTFEVVITSSKNNCWVTVKNKGRRYRTVFSSHAGNVGFRKAARKTEMATQRIAENVAKKLKRLGVVCCEVTFRRIMKVETCLQAFQQCGLQVTRLTHQPRLPKGVPHKPRKQRRV